MPDFTLIIPFYRNCGMLRRQLEELRAYPRGVQVIVVDDCSPEPALPLIDRPESTELLGRLQLYRITVDIPWNREGARNLASSKCATEWLVHVDIDHVLPAAAAAQLLRFEPTAAWYRFPRWRVGKADETRRKDAIADEVTFGPIHPHIDSYLCRRETYWQAGGYDEDFAGCLGGGSEFLKRLERTVGAPTLLPSEIALHVYTRDRIVDASDYSLSRDREQGKRIARAKGRASRPANPIRFPWTREL